MKNKEYLSQILPHKGNMILIDDVLHYSLEEKSLYASVTIDENSLFYDKELNGIDGVIGIEYMAQAAGCYAYYRKKFSEPEMGYLLGTRLYNNGLKKFEKGRTYYISVKEVYAAEIYSFECLIYNDKKEEVSSASINLYQED